MIKVWDDMAWEDYAYCHVTYFWHRNKSEKFSEELEPFKEVPSDKVSFDERPWMKSVEITDDLIESIKSFRLEPFDIRTQNWLYR